MTRFVFAMGVLGIILTATKPAAADLITYTESFTGSGTLNGQAFNNATIVLTGTGDTADIQNFGPFYSNDQIAMSITIGVSTVTFNDTFNVFVNQSQGSFGFQDNNVDQEFTNINSPSFDSYNLGGPLAAVVVAGGPGYDSFYTYGTSGGSLKFTSASGPTTVSAAPATTSTPEPSSLAIAGVGGLGMGYWLLRRRRNALLSIA
jgi:hypothetical protein